jgi:plastocyanin
MKAAIATVGVTAAIAFAGCGGADSSSTTSSGSASTAAAAETTDAVEISDFKYAPATVTVDAGTQLTWTNSDEAAHTATADDGSFDTGDLDRGDSKGVLLDEPGTYTYFCRFHPFMKATVEVR